MGPKRGLYKTFAILDIKALSYAAMFERLTIVTPEGINVPIEHNPVKLKTLLDCQRCNNCGVDVKSAQLVVWPKNPVPKYRSFIQLVSTNGYHLLTVDHIIAVSKGGSNDPENLQTLCEVCNRGKSNKGLEEWEIVRHLYSAPSERSFRTPGRRIDHLASVDAITRASNVFLNEGPEAAREFCISLPEPQAMVVLTALNHGIKLINRYLEDQIDELKFTRA